MCLKKNYYGENKNKNRRACEISILIIEFIIISALKCTIVVTLISEKLIVAAASGGTIENRFPTGAGNF